jgi:sugar phosphate permease
VGIALYGLLVIGYFLARLVVGERWNLVAFANNFVPWIVAGGVFLCLMALFSRHRWVLIAFQVPGIVAFLVLFGALFLPKGSAEEHADGPELTVATYNGFG